MVDILRMLGKLIEGYIPPSGKRKGAPPVSLRTLSVFILGGQSEDVWERKSLPEILSNSTTIFQGYRDLPANEYCKVFINPSLLVLHLLCLAVGSYRRVSRKQRDKPTDVHFRRCTACNFEKSFACALQADGLNSQERI